MKPLLSIVVTICLVVTVTAANEKPKELAKEPIVEAESSDPQARKERCTTCSSSAKLNLKDPKELLAAIKQLPGEVHTQQSFEGCTSEKGCAGIKVKDGQVIQKFGNLDAFKQAAAQDTANEFDFHAAGSSVFQNGGPFWWMNQNSPFKNTGTTYEKFSKTSSSYTSTGGGVDLSSNPFLNGDFSKLSGGFTSAGGAGGAGIQSSSSFESSSFGKGELDISKNPFLNGGVKFGSNQFAGQSSGFGAAGFSDSAQGYTGSSPSPFSASTAGSNINLIQNSQKGFGYEQNVDEAFQSTGNVLGSDQGDLTQTCAGQGYVCVPRAQCNNGVVNANGANILQANTQKQYCNLRSEICCRIEVTSSGANGISGSGLGVDSATFSGSNQGSGLFSTNQGNFGSSSGFGASTFGSTANRGYGSSVGTNLAPTTPRFGTSQSNFINTDAFSTGNEFRPGAVGLKPGIPYLPPVDSSDSPSNIVPSTVYPTPFVTTPRPFPTPRPITPRPFPTSKPTYLPPVPSTSAPGYLPPIAESSIPREVIVPPYDEGQLYLDDNRTPAPVPRPFNPGPVPSGCAAALKCTPIEFCTSEGVISNVSVSLTRSQEAYRVPLTDCKDPETGRIGKCCRDPFYTDPWPSSQIGSWVTGIFGGNDGKYEPDNRGNRPNNQGPLGTATPPSTGKFISPSFRPETKTPGPTFGLSNTPGYPATTVSPGPFRDQGIPNQPRFPGVGPTSTPGLGVGVNQGFGFGQTQGVGVGQTQGLGKGVSQGGGAVVTQGGGQIQNGGRFDITQDKNIRVSQGFGDNGFPYDQGAVQSVPEGVQTAQGFGVETGTGRGVKQGVGVIVNQGSGLGGSQGVGFGANQGNGFGFRQGSGVGTRQGTGIGATQGTGFGVRQGSQGNQGSGLGVSQGAGFGVRQGSGVGVRQGTGIGATHGSGFVASQGAGFGVNQGGIGVAQGGRTGGRQGIGFGGNQGAGFGASQGAGLGASRGGIGLAQAGGAGVRQGTGLGVSQGAGFGTSQGAGFGVNQGGIGVAQGGGAGVRQGTGLGVSQGTGFGASQGAGFGASQGGIGLAQTGGAGVRQGAGLSASQGAGFGGRQGGVGVRQGGLGVTQGNGFGVSQGGGLGVAQGGGLGVGQGGGAGVRQGGGFGTQGAGLGVSQGSGFGVRQGTGFGTSQGNGLGVSQSAGIGGRQGFGAQGSGLAGSQGFGAQGAGVGGDQGGFAGQGGGFNAQSGLGTSQRGFGGQGAGAGGFGGRGGQGFNQGGSFGANQGAGNSVRQGGGFGTSQVLGFGASQGFGSGVQYETGQRLVSKQGQRIVQGTEQGVIGGGGFGIKNGGGFIVTQGGGYGVQNDYTETVYRVFLQRYSGAGQCGLLNPQKPYGNHNELEVDFAQIPWQAMVLLQTNRSLLCGGVITRPEVVVTTASCVNGLDAKNILIKGGEWKLGIDDEPLPFQIVQVKTIIRHPEYKIGSLKNDVAILVLTENLRFAKNIQPICLPSKSDTLDAFYNGAGECIVTGWGKVVLQAHLQGSIMHSVNVSLINPGECQAKLSSDYPHLLEQYDQDSCVCGQPSNPLNSICKVDTGSALACTTGDSHFVLRGVYSWDSGCQLGNQIAGFYKFDIEWYEWAIGLIESVRFAKYTKVTVGKVGQVSTVTSTKYTTGVKTTGVKEITGGQLSQFSGSKQVSQEFGKGQTGAGQVFGQTSGSLADQSQFSTGKLYLGTNSKAPVSKTITTTFVSKGQITGVPGSVQGAGEGLTNGFGQFSQVSGGSTKLGQVTTGGKATGFVQGAGEGLTNGFGQFSQVSGSSNKFGQVTTGGKATGFVQGAGEGLTNGFGQFSQVSGSSNKFGQVTTGGQATGSVQGTGEGLTNGFGQFSQVSGSSNKFGQVTTGGKATGFVQGAGEGLANGFGQFSQVSGGSTKLGQVTTGGKGTGFVQGAGEGLTNGFGQFSQVSGSSNKFGQVTTGGKVTGSVQGAGEGLANGFGQFSQSSGSSNKFGQFTTGGITTGVKGVKGVIAGEGSGQGFGKFSQISGTGQFSQIGGVGGKATGQGFGQFSQFGTGKFTEGLNFGSEIKPITNTFSATFSEKKVFQSEPKYVTYTTKPEIVTYTTKPEIVTFTTKPEYFTYTTKPEIVTFTTKPEYFTFTTKPKLVTYTTKPQFITYQTSDTITSPQIVAPDASFKPSFSEIVGNHKHNAECKCLEGKK